MVIKDTSGKGKSIVLVEDDEVHIRLLSSILRNRMYKVTTALNGQEGVERVRAEKPDLIITDVRMPVMDGYEFMEKLDADPETKDIPIICLTASVMTGSKEALLAAGCNSYIAKPFSKDDFVKEIKKYI